MYEHQYAISLLKAEEEKGLKQAGEQACEREQELLTDKRALKQQIREQVLTTDLRKSHHLSLFS